MVFYIQERGQVYKKGEYNSILNIYFCYNAFACYCIYRTCTCYYV